MKPLPAILLFVFLAGGLSTCKKYPENDRIYLKSKKERVTGEYRIDYFEVDGIDSTSQVPANCNQYLFGPDHSRPGTWIEGCGAPGGWGFQNHKKNLLLRASDSFDNILNFMNGRELVFTIRKLTNSEMWLDGNFYGKNYYIKFYKTQDW